MGQDLTIIKHWLERRFAGSDHKVLDVRRGSYGVVWIMETEHDYVVPPRFAIKGFDPEKKIKKLDIDVRALFERELALWLRVPSHRNVLSALGLEFIPVQESPDPSSTWPFVRMGFMDGSLEDWIGKPDPPVEQRLAVLAQCCNGLAWLYQNGLHGHGDLKPANVLLCDLTRTFSPAPDLPRWKAVVADLGWADIWREFEGRDAASRAWRPYLAPERLDGVVEREASDMFGVGIMAAELLGGIHPTGIPSRSVSSWNERDYAKWAKGRSASSPIRSRRPLHH